MKAIVHGGRGLGLQTQVTIIDPINSRQYLSCAAHDHENAEVTRRRCPYFRRRVDLVCAAVAQRALGHAQVTAGGAERVSP